MTKARAASATSSCANFFSALLLGSWSGEDCACVGEELRPDRSVMQQGRCFERRCIARRKHGQLVIDLLPLFRQQTLEQRVLDDRQVDGVEVALGSIGIDSQRPISEFWRLFRPFSAKKLLHRFDGC